MLTLIIRRSLAQRRLLTGIVILVTLGTTLIGVGVLLLSTTQDRAFTVGIGQSPPEDVDVSAFVVGVNSSDASTVREQAHAVVRDVLGPLRPTVSASATSRMRRFGDGTRLAYLATTDSLDERADLTSGRWPRARGEAVLPQTAAERLDLSVGARITLGAETGTDPVDNSVTVSVVGTFRPSSAQGWSGDPLAGRGVDVDFSNGTVTAPAFGPLVVDDATLAASGSTTDALQVTGHPSLAGATEDVVAGVAGALPSAERLLSQRVSDRVDISRLASDLPQTLDRAQAQQSATRSTVLVVLLLSATMALTALLLAGRLLAGVREAERALLVELGLDRRQVIVVTLGETLAVAVVATVLSVPAAALAHSAITHLPALRSAGLSQAPAVTLGLVLTGMVCAVLLALALVIPLLRAAAPRGRAVDVARTGMGPLLAVLAVAAWWELHSQPATRSSGDVIRTLAPVVCLVAAVAVAARCVPPVLRLVAAAASRSPALVPSLATSQAARRPHAGAAFVLLATAAASATFALSVQSTWERSQGDQAALRAGTDLSLGLTTPATAEDAATIRVATRGTVSSAVVERPIVLGRYVGDAGSPPRLVAVDSRRAGDLLRGRLDGGRSWSDVGDLLAPAARVVGPDVSSGVIEVEGTSPAGATIVMTPTVVVQDDAGFRSTAAADPVELDGRRHALRGLPPLDGSRLVAVRMDLHRAKADRGASNDGTEPISIALSVGGPDSSDGATDAAGARTDWHVQTLDAADSPIVGSAIATGGAADGTTVRINAQVDLAYLSFADGGLLATAFVAPDVLPVAVSQRLADVIGTKVGGELRSTVDGVSIPIAIVAIVPAVPSVPGQVTVLADAETLSRMLVGAGHVDPVVDAWWVADPPPATVRALTALGLGDVVTRTGLTDQLQRGPLRASVPAALALLVIAACVLLLAGVALVVGADRRTRSAEVARLRALGLSRRTALRLVIAEHGIVLGMLVLAGALVGALASVAIGPDLIRSDVGVAPIPAAVLEWPWWQELAVVVGGLGGCVAVAAVVSIVAVRRSGPEQLRTED